MKQINFKTATAILALLMIAAVFPSASINTANAAEPTVPTAGALPSGVTPAATIDAKAYLSCRPTTVGLDQTILVNLWMTPAPGGARKFLDFKVTITDPDGHEEVITIDSYQDDGTAWFEYPMSKLGEWTLKFEFQGMYFPPGTYSSGEYIGAENTAPPYFTFTGPFYYTSAYYTPSTAQEIKVTVQEDMVASYQEDPLPTDYWTRPVAYEHRGWAQILGDYPYTGVGSSQYYPENTNKYASNYEFTPYVEAPESAHVVWKKQFAIAGILGGDYGQRITDTNIFGMGNGFTPSIIYAGRGYQTVTKAYDGKVQMVWQCYDIRTGEIYWEILPETYTSVSFFGTSTASITPSYIEYEYGQIWGGGGSSDQSVTVSLIFIGNGRLIKFNPMTGAITGNYSIAPLTSGTYYMNGYALSVQATPTGNRLINWTTCGTSGDLSSRIVSNISFPVSSLPTCVDYETGVAAAESTLSQSGGYVGMNAYGISLTTGQVLWNITTNDVIPYSADTNVADHGKFAILTTRGYYVAYDLLTGNVAWTGEEMDSPWDESGFGAYGIQSAYGLFFREAYSGIYAFDWDDGSIVWKFEAECNPYETPYIDENGTSVYSWNVGAKIADGKLYTYTTEHSASVPITRGWGLYCIDAITGEGIWNVSLPGASSKHTSDMGAIADGYLTIFGSDGYMYVYGKGESQTTVSAPQTAVPVGTGIIISGTVLDMSPAQQGTPCISEDSMGTYMEYIHKQLALPSDVTLTGVPISIDAVDPNGNIIHIATVTSDISGTFGYTWTPPDVPGQYAITATFAGDASYGSSYAQTYVSVVEASQTTSTPSTSTQVNPDAINTTTFAVGVIAIIIAVALATVLILRKHP